MEQSRHGEGVTSVKVHNRPGGNSSIQLGGGYGDDEDRWGNRANKPANTTAGVPAVSNAVEEEKKEEDEECKETQQPAAAGGAVAAGGHSGVIPAA